MNIGRNEVSGFQYATTLSTSAQYIVPAFGTASAGLVKKIRITDIKGSAGATARTIRISGQGGNFKDFSITFPANSSPNYNFEMPYVLDCVSSTGAVRGIYASAAANSEIKVVICGFVETKN